MFPFGPDVPKDEIPEKERLEREKLRLEIKELDRSWWKRPPYILAALPTLLAVLTVIYGFANGYFQATATKLENQRHDLQADVKEFTERKEKLEGENRRLSGEVERHKMDDELFKKITEGDSWHFARMTERVIEAQKEIKRLKEENEALRKENEFLKNQK